MRLIISFFLLVLFLGGCASSPVRMTDAKYQSLDALRLTNGDVELVIVPSIGRIVHYGPVGGPNVLWENTTPDELQGGWRNWGGDKIWLWPQDEWDDRTGAGWRPPAAFDAAKYAVRQDGKGAIVVTSPPLKSYGVRIVRRIELAPRGARVTSRTWLEPDDGNTQPAPAAVWQVTQTAKPKKILAAMLHDGAFVGVARRDEPDRPWRRATPSANGPLALTPAGDVSEKVGLDANVLAAEVGDWLLLTKASTMPAAPFQPFTRAQVYSEAGGSGQPAKYVELEYTSPVMSADGGRPELVVEWDLHPLRTERGNDSAEQALRNLRE